MLSIHRVIVTAAAAAALAAPAAQAMPADAQHRSTSPNIDLVSPDARLGVRQPASRKVDRVTPDARDQRRLTVAPVPPTRAIDVPSNDGFEWGDAAIGGGAGAAIAFVLLVGGGALTALTVRPRRGPATSR